MHKAKGLEFDHVLLFGLGRTSRASESDVLNWLFVPDDEGRNDMLISPVGSRSLLERDPLHRFIATTQVTKERSELDRLLYVACTRARKSLHLIGHIGVSADGEEYRKPNSLSALHRLWPALEAVYSAAFEGYKDDATSAADGDEGREELQLTQPILRRLRDDWGPPELPAVPRPELSSNPATDQEEKRVEFYWVGSSARHAGTIVHRWLQRFSDNKDFPEASELAQLQTTSARWARSLGVADEQIAAVCTRVEKALAGIIADAKGRWILTGDGHSELPITGVVNGELESVILDRIRIDGDGTHWIVDYKTSTHEGGDLQGFLHQEVERYRSQLEKYAALYSGLTTAPVRTALYFPLLQEFQEISRTE
jgi:ATP-dependent helicase/nuclease subunit A